MAQVTFHGNETNIGGELPSVGSTAPDFTLVSQSLKDLSLSEWDGKKKLIYTVPSLDTPVCAQSTKKLNDFAREHDDTVILIVSADLPFAMGRFCANEGADNVITLSLMRGREFVNDYGVLIEDGPLAGVTTRAIIVVDENDTVVYSELVSEITSEPDYAAALKALG